MTTPLGTYKTLREQVVYKKLVRGYKYSVFGWVPAPEYSTNKTITVYRWYSEEKGLQIAEAHINKHGYIENIRFQYDSPMLLTPSIRNVNCKGKNNGLISLKVQGGIPDYEFEWSDGSINQNLIKAKVGTYNVTVTDNRNRKISGTYSITEPLIALSAKLKVENVSCRGAKNGSIQLKIVGGKKPYENIWSNDSSSTEISKLKPGRYRVWIRDANKCVISDSVEITQPERKLQAIIEKKHVSCFKGSDGELNPIIEGGSPPYKTLWSNGDTALIAKGLVAGNYIVKITDSNGCTFKKEAVLKQAKEPLVITKTINPASCFGVSNGSIQISVKGGKPGYSYFWSDSTDLKNLRGIPSGNYKLSVTDKNGCKIEDEIFVPQPENPIAISLIHSNISCFGENDGSVIAEVSGGSSGYKYLWSNGSTKNNLKKLPKGIYRLKLTDKNNCKAYDTVEIIGPEKALFIDFDKKDVICKGSNTGEIKLNIEGGSPDYSVIWSDKQTGTELENLKAGKYSVIVTDKHKCKAKKGIDIIEPKAPLSVKVEKNDIDCFNEKSGSIYISATGGKPGYTYKWSNGEESQNMIGLGAGKFTIKVTDDNLCETIEIVELKQPDELKLDAKITHSEIDKTTGAITINITGGTKPHDILWDFGQTTNTISDLARGVYQVTVTDSKDCILDKAFNIEEK
ncbi:MAG: hypothetical protein B6I20_12260 [Bacteroidetes bacterium 4572_117]|nr:MAG: hypothetical protein B6I20_12260 [Bacteroidetes bacterium 4572_117]